MEPNYKDKALKEALRKRETSELPSNFTYRMMNDIRLEAAKRRKRRRFIFRAGFIVSILAIIVLLYLCLIHYMNFNLMNYMPHPDITRSSSQVTDFYWYIGALVLILLGFDHWMRRRRKKTTDSY